MPLTIWKPRQYAQGFADKGAEGSFLPDNGEHAAAPFNRDTKVREVTRFTGWTIRKYCDAGEFEAIIPAGYVEPGEVVPGYLVTIDDYVYMIEGYEWTLTESGYECTISGRDLGALLERHVPTFRRASGAISAETVEGMKSFLQPFFTSYFNYASDINNELPETCGWFRDVERRPLGGWVVIDPDESDGEPGSYTSADVELISYGAALRLMASYRDLGYRFNCSFNEGIGLHTLQLELYKPQDSGVMLRSTGRGVSGFTYSRDTRDAVNAVFAVALSRWGFGNGMGWVQAEEPIYGRYGFQYDINGANWAEIANAWSGAALDLGEIPEENDATAEAGAAWMREQVKDAYQTEALTVEMEYDNSGAYRYGEHFGLGSQVTIKDDFLNIASVARLVEVETKYEAGAAKAYGFKFGDNRITQADKLKKKFSHLEKKSYSV